MNTESQATFISAMKSICSSPTLADVHKWGVPQGKYRNFLWAVSAVWGLPATMPVAKARSFLSGRVEYLKSVIADRPEKMTLLTPTLQMLAHIEAFEQRDGRPS